jgi:hypothetical protein
VTLLLNPTKKSAQFFRYIELAEKDEAPKVNKFFSWTANNLAVAGKKCLFLVNDLTYASVFIANVTAEDRKNLAEIVHYGIDMTFDLCGIKRSEIDEYFATAGETKVYKAHDNAAISVNNRLNWLGSWVSDKYPIDLSDYYQPMYIKQLLDYPVGTLKYRNPAEATRLVFDEWLAGRIDDIESLLKSKKKKQ